MKLLNATLGALMIGLVSMPAFADKGGNNECPVGLVNGLTLDQEFGFGTQDLTRCNKVRKNVKLVIQINAYGTDTRAYALGNITNVIADYEVTYGMRPGKDYEIVAVVHSGGGPLVIKNGTTGNGINVVKNTHEAEVQALMNQGVKFYFCQNTTRGMQAAGSLPADATSALVTSVDDKGVEHSVQYVTAGIAAIADFQARGYQYVQP